MKIKERTFEDFAQEMYDRIDPALFEHYISYSFNEWFEVQSKEDCINWANIYGREQYLMGKADILDKFNKKQIT